MNPVLVIGGGPAGIAAACALADRGKTVLLLERSPRLGGRAASFFHRRIGEEIDYGQHVLLGACTRTIDLLVRIGEAGSLALQPAMRVPIAWPGGRSILKSSPLPGPLHLLPSLLSYWALSLGERLAVLRAGLGLLQGAVPEDVPFSVWLSRRGQSPGVIASLWDPITIATLNARCEQAAARSAAFVFREGIFRRGGARLGLFTRPLSLVFSAAAGYLEARGGSVRLRCGVRRILVEQGAVWGIELEGGPRLVARTVIAAVPPGDLLTLLPDDLQRIPPFSGLAGIRPVPIVDVHLWVDRPVMPEPFVVAIRSPLQAIFDATRLQRRDGPTHLVVSQSAAVPWMRMPVEAVQEQLLDALRELLPAMGDACLLDALVIRHPRATFLPAPGVERLRPPAGTPINGLVLAGDYTRTGWPSTIEGAVRSGERAAAMVC